LASSPAFEEVDAHVDARRDCPFHPN
jgi:hypothetical protein